MLLADFGYARKGACWVLKRELSRSLTIPLLALGLAMLLFSLVGFSRPNTDDRVFAAVMSGVGALMLLSVWRERTYLDPGQRAFVVRRLVGQRLFPFDRVQVIRPVRHYLNGTFQGIYYQLEATEDGPRLPPLRVSHHFSDFQDSFEQALRQAMSKPY